MFVKLRLSILFARLPAQRCPPRHRSLPVRNRLRWAAPAFALTRRRPVLLPLHPSRPRHEYSQLQRWFLFSAWTEFHGIDVVGQALSLARFGSQAGGSARLEISRRWQSSSQIFCGVFAKFLFEHRWIGEFSRIGARQRGLKGLMPGQRI